MVVFSRPLFFLLGFVFVVFGKATGQPSSPIPLSLDSALARVRNNNLQLRLAQVDVAMARNITQQAKAVWMPQLQFSYSAYQTNNPLNAFGFKLQQAQVKASDFNPDLLNHPGNVALFQTQLQWLQPLINADKWMYRKILAGQSEMATLQTQRMGEALEAQVTEVFLQLQFLVATKKVAQQALATMEAFHAQAQHKFEQGLLPSSDLLMVGVQVKSTETQVYECERQIADVSDALGQMMHAPMGVVYAPLPLSLVAPISLDKDLPLERADLLWLKKAATTQELAIASTRNAWLPRLNGVAQYQRNDAKALGFGAGNYFAGLQLSWDILNGHQTKTKLASQQLEKQKLDQQYLLQVEQSALALQQVARKMQSAQFQQKQQVQAVQQAQEALRIVENRFGQGLSSTQLVLQAQVQLAQQKLGMEQAKWMEQTAFAHYQFLTRQTKSNE